MEPPEGPAVIVSAGELQEVVVEEVGGQP